MNEETNKQLANNQGQDAVPRPSLGGEKVIQPPEGIKQELEAQNAQHIQQSPETSPIQSQSNLNQASQNQQVPFSSNSANIYHEPSLDQMQSGMSASQMGYNQPTSKLFDLDLKHLLIKGLISLVILFVVFAILVYTNIIALSEFKSLSYANSKGTNYRLDFYTKHSSKRLKSGNTQLVSKVSKAGKFPIGLSISTGELSDLNKNGIKTCGGPFPKVMDVHNNNINHTIAVCYLPQKDGPVGVYIAGFEYNNQAHIITIGQDMGDIDLSSQSGAKESLTKFGIEPYKSDIERIVSSIKVE